MFKRIQNFVAWYTSTIGRRAARWAAHLTSFFQCFSSGSPLNLLLDPDADLHPE
jgi:hypothetical protein